MDRRTDAQSDNQTVGRRQAQRQTDRQTDRQTVKQTGKQEDTDRLTDRWTSGWMDELADRESQGQTNSTAEKPRETGTKPLLTVFLPVIHVQAPQSHGDNFVRAHLGLIRTAYVRHPTHNHIRIYTRAQTQETSIQTNKQQTCTLASIHRTRTHAHTANTRSHPTMRAPVYPNDARCF